MKPTLKKRIYFFFAVGFLVFCLTGTISYSLQLSLEPLTGNIAQILKISPEFLNHLRTTKTQVDMNVMRNTYFTRNDIPYIIIRGIEEIPLMSSEIMEAPPTSLELQKSKELPEELEHLRGILKAAPTTLELDLLKEPEQLLKGFIKELLGEPTEEPTTRGGAQTLPEVVDHRGLQTSIKYQGDRGTCVAHASLASLETFGIIPDDLSEEYAHHLFMMKKGGTCYQWNNNCSRGLKTTDSADYLSSDAVPEEQYWLYQNTCANLPHPHQPPAAATTNAFYKIKSYQKIWDLGTDDEYSIKNTTYLEGILASGYNIVYATYVTWTNDQSNGIIDVNLDPNGDPLEGSGGHAMLMVGYNRPQQYFIVKNSWGANWGHNGYAYISYDYVKTYSKYGYYILQAASAAPSAAQPDLLITNVSYSPSSPKVGDTLTFTVSVKNAGTAGASNVKVLVRDQKGWGNQGTINSISAGQIKNISLQLITSQVHTTYNPHNFVATVDPSNTIAESNENNNQYQVPPITVIAAAAAVEIQTGLKQYSHNQQITFPKAFSRTPVILTSAQKGGIAYIACAVNNSSTGFRLSVIDHQGKAGSNVWVQWVAIVPPAGMEIQTGLKQYSHNQQITFPKAFSRTPVILTSAQKGGIAYIACAVNNSSTGFRLSVIDHQGKAGSNVWVQWLAIVPPAVSPGVMKFKLFKL